MITTVSTVKDDVTRLQRWVDRNMAAGVDRMVIFVDHRDDPQTAELLNARPGVLAVDAGTWWGLEYPARLNVRQRINANAALSVLRTTTHRNGCSTSTVTGSSTSTRSAY